MGIKWKDVRVLNSPLTNKIYLGKVRVINTEKGHLLATDKSEDKTEEIISAVCAYMDEELNRMKGTGNKLEIVCEAGRLIWERNKSE